MRGGCVAVFQFHYGTIKRIHDIYTPAPFEEFQFHYGTIKSPMQHESKAYPFISIPLWYD